jgi:branched-chain amino acid transport system substrate-binding protein
VAHHEILQRRYLIDVVKDPDGELSLKTVATIVENDQDRFHDKCPIK